MFNTVDKALAWCHLQLFNPWSGWLKISKDTGIWGWSAASRILLRKKNRSETWERYSNPLGASPQKQILHAMGFSTLPRAHKALFTCGDTCTEQLPTLAWKSGSTEPTSPASTHHGGFFSNLYIQVSWVHAQEWQCCRSLLRHIRLAANFTNTVLHEFLCVKDHIMKCEK